jgi:RHS repeat-associated protein
MLPLLRPSCLLLLLILASSFAFAQVQSGTPPFGSFGGGPDVIDLANLNSHISIPIVHRAGRGTDFVYDLDYESLVFYPVTSGGVTTWQPTNNWGWNAQTAVATGFISSTQTQQKCFDSHHVLIDIVVTTSNFVYHDPYGVNHPFSGRTIDPGECPTPAPQSINSIATDGSGYGISSAPSAQAKISTPDGTVFLPPGGSPSGGGSFTDRNGNKISDNGLGVFTDTLGTTALTVSTGVPSPTVPVTLTYTDTSGTAQHYTVQYTSKIVQTNFGCVTTDYGTNGTTTANLVSEIDLPDGVSKYTFTYEQTPGFPTHVTGRLASIKLPTGGTISYAYSGGNNGINCSDGTVATLTRTTPDGTWTYARSLGTGVASTTTVTAPKLSYDSIGNDTVIQFQGLYETERKIYQGSNGTGTLLQTVDTCYNAATSPCTGTTIAQPIAQVAVIATVPGAAGLKSQSITKFNSFGQLTEKDEYDLATATPYPLLRQTLITFANLGGNLNAFRQTVTAKDGAGAIKFRQDTTYDQTALTCVTGAPNHDDAGFPCGFTSRGNATTVTNYTDPVTPSGALNKTFTFDSVGNMRTAQLNCCQQKTWSYSAGTKYAFPDSVTSGSSSPQLTINTTYDLHMGLPMTTTDPNSIQSVLTYDALGRTLTSKIGSNPTSNYTYNDYDNSSSFTNWTVKVCSPVQNSDTVCQSSILDSQGRTITSKLLDGTGALKSATDTQYDPLGRAFMTSNPYTSSASYWTQTNFDALGRVIKTIAPSPDSSNTSILYADNTVTTTDPALVKRKAVSDGLGRMTSLYEPDPSSGNTLTLITSYTYNLLDQLTQITQGAQTRTYSYDATGRLLSATTPEAGRVCFGSVTGSTCNTDGYDTFNNLLKRTDARGVLTSYGYDTLNRLTSVAYNVGTSGVTATPSVSLTYGLDSSCNAAHGAGCIGQVISMTDGAGSENYTYNNFGQMTQLSKAIGTTTYPLIYAYNLAGELTSVTYPSGRVITQNLDNIGRLSSIVGNLNSVNTTYASGFGYGSANQITGFHYGNNVYASFGYSADRLQLNCLDYSTTNRSGACAHDGTTKFGVSFSYGSAGSNNGLLGGITDSVDGGRSATYTYDSLYRLTSAITTGSTNYPKWGLSESYDRYGNRTAQSTITGQGCTGITCPTNSVAVSATTNRITSGGYAYDANGNMTNDGTNTLVYDAENRTLSSTNGSASGTYTYDGNGLRVKKVSGGITTITIFSGGLDIAEYPAGAAPSSPTNEYIYSGNQKIAILQSGTTYYFHNDHLSPRLRTNTSGTVVDQRGHFPFGETWYSPAGAPLLFTSYYRDAESGNDYATARYNISRLGRFSSPDPISGSTDDPQSLNRYSYTQDNPINATDPSGAVTTMCTQRRDEACPYSNGGGFVFGSTWNEFDIMSIPVYGYSFFQTQVSWKMGTQSGTGDPILNWGYGIIGYAMLQSTDSGALYSSDDSGGGLVQKIKSAFCKTLPSGRTIGVSGSTGGIGGVPGSVEIVTNFNTGQTSAVASGGVLVGWNGGAQASVNAGFIWGLGNNNANYSGGFTSGSASGGVFTGGFGIFGSSSSHGLNGGKPDFRVTSAGVSWGGSLIPLPTGGVSFTGTSQPVNLGSAGPPSNLGDYLMYLLRRPCQ